MQLWAGAAHYPDFLAHQAQSWWKDQIDTFNAMLPVDGIWLDMDEPDNFCSCDVAYDPGRYSMLPDESVKHKSQPLLEVPSVVAGLHQDKTACVWQC